MEEYPKVIVIDGIHITATSAENEAFWRTPPPAPVVVDEPVVAPVPPSPEPAKAAKPRKAKKDK